MGAALVLWGYRSIMASCPPPDDFGGCFEPQYRLSATVFALFWGSVELVLLISCVAGLVARRPASEDRADDGGGRVGV